jgi:CDGSH-type Zn-finger protein/truncated hemoglobin YjbI
MADRLDQLRNVLTHAGRTDDARHLDHAGEQPEIVVTAYGPYLVRGEPAVTDWLGCPLEPASVRALCRCGGSTAKPDCDGTCVGSGFSGEKSADRVPDRRQSAVGQQVTVFDNRGICQHSGYCTDRLATVFRQGREPFVAASGGRMDEIVRAVRDCPSGALSFAVDGVEAPEQVDHHGTRPPQITVTKDGPYRVIGSVPLVDETGADVPRADGASREHYALCRCGHSQNKPFCSGMHWYGGFRDPLDQPDETPTLFAWAGGAPALLRMTRIFYEKYVPNDEMLAPIFANMSADHPERVAAWLGEVFGGPSTYSTLYGGYSRMISEHLGRCLTEEWRARWVELLVRSAHEAGLPNDAEFASAFRSYLEWGSRLAVENSQTEAQPPRNMPMPHWDWGTAGPPGGRMSALAAPAEHETTVTVPAAGEPIGFAQHVRPMFRERDRQSMRFAFDLWAYADVVKHADAIAARLRNGSMPCDGAWPDERVAAFQRWIDEGHPA